MVMLMNSFKCLLFMGLVFPMLVVVGTIKVAVKLLVAVIGPVDTKNLVPPVARLQELYNQAADLMEV